MKNILKKNQLMITALAIMIAVAGYLQFSEEKLKAEDYMEVSGEVGALEQADVEDFSADGMSEDYSLDGLLDISDEDLAMEDLTEIDSLDSDVDVVMEDYLEEDMEMASTIDETTDVASAIDETADMASTENALTPEDGEVPGEAVFTGTTAVATLSEAKLLKEQVRAKNKETLLEIINNTSLSEEQKQNAVDSMVEMTEIAEKETAAEILLEAKGFSDVVVSISEEGVDVVVNATELTDAQRAQIEDIVKRKADVDASDIIISTVVQ